jgi:MFS family permease
MGSTEPASSATKDSATARLKSDRRLLLLFGVLAIISIAASVVSFSFIEGATLRDLASLVLGSLAGSFTIAGIPAYLRNRKNSLVSKRRVMRWMIVASLAVTVATIVGLALASIYAPDVVPFNESSFAAYLLMGVVLFVALFIAFFVLCIGAFLAVFGTIGVMCAVERSLASWTLRRIAHLSSDKKPSMTTRGLRWLFNVPDVLDTTTLSLRPAKPRTRVYKADLKTPVLWQLLFGFILAIYLSFNPFVSDRSSAALMNIFSLLTTASFLIPLIILPWFLFTRLGAEIRGQVKPFTLYHGIRSRVLQSYMAVGTIVIFVRLSIQDISIALEAYVAAFAAFMIVLLGAALLSTFVYYNYFENILAQDIIEGLRGTDLRIEDSEESD